MATSLDLVADADYLVEAILEVNARKDALRGFRIVSEPKFLRHFTARFAPV